MNWKPLPVRYMIELTSRSTNSVITSFFFRSAGVPKSIYKTKKEQRHSKYSNGNDDKSHTFHVPRNLDIQLEQTKVTHYDVINLRYYTEYQWLVDFSLYACIIYVLSEVYHFFIPLKDEVNLSMMWCLLVIFFALWVPDSPYINGCCWI